MNLDPETGELREEAEQCPNCTQAIQDIARAELQLRSVERELTNQLRTNGRLRAELERQRMEAPEGRVARILGKYWIVRCQKSKRTKLGEKRMKAVIARLRDGYTPEYIARAIDGAAVAATTSSPEAERQALIRVMEEAVRRVDDKTADELRAVYREAMHNVPRYDDLELICRDETKLERLYDAAERTNAPTLLGPVWLRDIKATAFKEPEPDSPF